VQRTIAVSACLLGYQVRYDGAAQAIPELCQPLSELFLLEPICPEMEIGLGVPREKIELHQRGKYTHLLTCHAQEDLTAQMQKKSQEFLESNRLSGMILKDKSPSCGVGNCKIWDKQGKLERNGTGIFAATIKRLQPHLPMIQSCDLVNAKQLQAFIQAVEAYEY